MEVFHTGLNVPQVSQLVVDGDFTNIFGLQGNVDKTAASIFFFRAYILELDRQLGCFQITKGSCDA